ncbi:MAG: alpha/beta hydrolase [Candidatus Dadabacteria bacterium]|nr:alpha/beta hydrolase [Candidatus Dadabacteria bacterium]
MTKDLDFIHKYVPASDAESGEAVFIFHGTGGDEESLLPVASAIMPGAAVVSPRGKVLENGMPRFFRRLAEGVFDLEDLHVRTEELAKFVESARTAYGLEGKKLVAAGYSNGANIAASILLTYPGVFSKAALFHPMVPFVPERLPDLSGTEVLITAGTNDPIVVPEGTRELARLLRQSGALVDVFWHDRGHSLTSEELSAAGTFLA